MLKLVCNYLKFYKLWCTCNLRVIPLQVHETKNESLVIIFIGPGEIYRHVFIFEHAALCLYLLIAVLC